MKQRDQPSFIHNTILQGQTKRSVTPNIPKPFHRKHTTSTKKWYTQCIPKTEPVGSYITVPPLIELGLGYRPVLSMGPFAWTFRRGLASTTCRRRRHSAISEGPAGFLQDVSDCRKELGSRCQPVAENTAYEWKKNYNLNFRLYRMSRTQSKSRYIL